jgi:hypothetical protein
VITGAAFCPHPPVLVPEVAGGAAPELDDLRAACRSAIRRVAHGGSRLVAVGAGDATRGFAATARGSLAPFGVPVEIPLGTDEPAADPADPAHAAAEAGLPLSLTVGAWLLRDALGPGCGAVGRSVGPQPGPALDLPAGPVALLVLGDGSARRSASAPGYLDERADAFDAAIAAALAAGDPERLRTDVGLGDELLAAGPRTWNAAADVLAGARWDAELLYDAAPYGVGYFAAAWTRR